ncbi:Serine/threonine-protein kinase [Ceratobasidium sp. AG-Ba]|nr:Serine/threonine-protein kinase [Ceratobasidium sp. AG-Ba]
MPSNPITKGRRANLKDVEARELYYWSRLKHKNVVGLLGLAEFRGQMAMISPWQANGTLLEYIHRSPEVDRLRLCVDVFDGLAYLHTNDTVHGDIKSMNVLVSNQGVAKIADFGCAELKLSELVFTATMSKPGTPRWSSPEKLMNGRP